MKRDKTHMESVERWAQYVLTHPDWKKQHTQFINSQYEMAYKFMDRLKATPEGREKAKKILDMRRSK